MLEVDRARAVEELPVELLLAARAAELVSAAHAYGTPAARASIR